MNGAGLASFTENWNALMDEVRAAGPVPCPQFPPSGSRRISSWLARAQNNPATTARLWFFRDERGIEYNALSFEHAQRLMVHVDEEYLCEAKCLRTVSRPQASE